MTIMFCNLFYVGKHSIYNLSGLLIHLILNFGTTNFGRQNTEENFLTKYFFLFLKATYRKLRTQQSLIPIDTVFVRTKKMRPEAKQLKY